MEMTSKQCAAILTTRLAKEHDVVHVIENWIDEYDMDIFFTGNHFVEPDTNLVGDIGDSYN